MAGDVLVTTDILLADWYNGGDVYTRAAHHSHQGNSRVSGYMYGKSDKILQDIIVTMA